MSTEEERRYIGKLSVEKWKHRTVDTMCIRVRITLPNEILQDKNFKLKPGRSVLATVQRNGKIIIESV